MFKMKDAIWKTLIILGFCVSLILQIVGITHRRALAYDDPITYIVATGHQLEFVDAQQNMSNRWTTAADWKHYWHLDKMLCFHTIQTGLSKTDVSPPLYFWIFHIWLLVIGMELWGGPILNIIVWIASFILLYKVGRHTFKSLRLTSIGLFVWAVSPQVHLINSYPRQYALLGLISILYIYIVLRLLRPNHRTSPLLLIGMIITTTLGMLTHLYFILLIGSCLILILMIMQRRKRIKRILPFIIATLLGLLLFVMIYPQFVNPILGNRGSSFQPNVGDLYRRTADFITNHGAFFIPIHLVKYALIGVVLVIASIGILRLMKKQKVIAVKLKPLDRPELHLVIIYLFLILTMGALYIIGISPGHAVTAKYHSMIYPLLAFIPVILLKSISRKVQVTILMILCSIQMVHGIIRTREHVRIQSSIDTQETLNLQTESYLLDSVARGEISRVLFKADDEAQVFATWQDTLLVYPDRYLESLQDSTLYVNSPRFINTEAKKHRFIDLLNDHGFTIKNVTEDYLGVGEAYLVLKNNNNSNK